MTAQVGIVGYGMGNITSLVNAFRAIGADVLVAESARKLDEVSHIVLPGVGAFPKGMEHLRAGGFDAQLRRLVLEERRPLLGVCLGMHLLADVGEEHQVCPGLGFVAGRVRRLLAPGLRLPHVGWNDTVATRDGVLLGKAGTSASFYYVHGYGFVATREDDVAFVCDYGGPVVAGIESGHIFGVQFHPEKSHQDGLTLLRRFTGVTPC
jgi:glutamine amidotransferase